MAATYVITFDDFEPSPRQDDTPWTNVRILEAATRDGSYTAIDTQALDPVDLDPTNPQARSFTTANATMASGWYQVVFLDDAGNQSPSEPVYNNAELTGFMPGVGDVGALLTARTRDGLGREQGTFTGETRPTRDQVEQLIGKAAARTIAKLPSTNIPEPLWESISNVIALSAAMRVELSFFPDQITAGRSPYTELKNLRDEELADLIVALEAYGAESGTEDPHVASGIAIFVQPDCAPPRTAGAEWPTRGGW